MATPRPARKSSDFKSKPRRDGDSKPRYDKDSPPSDSKNDRPRFDSRSKPRSDRDAKPRFNSDSKPRFDRDSKPRGDRDSKPRFDAASKPWAQRDSSKPRFNKDSKPRGDRESAPKFGRDAKPRFDRDTRPSEARGSRPQFEKDSAPKNFRGNFDKSRTRSDEPSRADARASTSLWDNPYDIEEKQPSQWMRKVPEGAERLDEIKACGINSCRAIFAKRPSDLVRAYVTEETLKDFGDMLKFCSANKKAYHVVRPDELGKISGSAHHEGVCVIAKARPDQTWEALEKKLAASKTKPEMVLILEDVGNPHNVGAIVRTAAHFGVSGVLAAGKETFKPSPALLRTAEGGYESVGVTAAPELSVLVKSLRTLGFEIIATAAKGKATIFDEEAISPRVAFIVGNESRGISPDAKKLSDTTLSIPGTGEVDSLNVSAATSALCSEFWRAHKV